VLYQPTNMLSPIDERSNVLTTTPTNDHEETPQSKNNHREQDDHVDLELNAVTAVVVVPPEIFISMNHSNRKDDDVDDDAKQQQIEKSMTTTTINDPQQPKQDNNALDVVKDVVGDKENSNDLTLNPALVVNLTKYEDDYSWEHDPYIGSPESKYKRYELPVSHEEGDRALSINLYSFRKPHMRAFHCAWISFFLAFVIWFAPAPLLIEIGTTLSLSKQELWNSSIANDIMAITMRIIIGPIVDRYGARIPMAVALTAASIPCSMVGLVNTAAGLSLIRFFIGIAGCTFVMAQFWPSRMFAREISGTANGTVAGM
jgi:Major Facilitator Superfamily